MSARQRTDDPIGLRSFFSRRIFPASPIYVACPGRPERSDGSVPSLELMLIRSHHPVNTFAHSCTTRRTAVKPGDLLRICPKDRLAESAASTPSTNESPRD